MGLETSRLLEELEALQSGTVALSASARHSWDENDKAANVCVKENGSVARLGRESSKAGGIRGRRKYVRGLHFFEFNWKPGQGKRVCVGISTDEADLIPKDGLIAGADDNSIGWDLVSRKVYFNGCVVKTLPESDTFDGPVPASFIMCLNMNEGILSFSAKDHNFGDAMSGLKHIGTEICVMAEIDTPGDEIRMRYLGNADDLNKNLDTKELRFHTESGKNIELDNNAKTARRRNPLDCFYHATALTNRPLRNDEILTFRLDKKDTSKWQGGWMVGITTSSPLDLNFPCDMSKCTQGSNWVYNENRIGFQQKVVDEINSNLDDLKEGDTVGIKRSGDTIKFIVNGTIQTSVSAKSKENMYGFVDVYGQTIQVSIVGQTGKAGSMQLKKTASSPKTEEEFFERLQLTVKLLKRKSTTYIKETAAAVKLNLDKVYHDFTDRKLRKIAAEKLANCDGAMVIYDYVEFLEQRGIEEESLESQLLESLLSVCWNYSDNSLYFARKLGDCGLLDKLIKFLSDLAETYKKSKLSILKVLSAFGILHNCSKATENKPIYRRLDFIAIAQPYTNCNRHHYEIVMNAVMTISYVCEENHSEVVKLADGVAEYIVKDLRKAVASTDEGNFHQHSGWHAYEIAVGMTNLTISAANISKFVSLGAITHLSQMLLFEDANEIECALNAIWSLLTRDTVLSPDTASNLMERLGKLKLHSNENIKDGAVRLETKMKTLGVTGGQVRTPTSGKCEYTEKCKRFLQSLDIPDAYMDTTFNNCYCAKCHGKRGDKAYFDKGEPPKSYGVPVGWYRFGLSVPPQAAGNKAFEQWHRAFHGTKKEAIQKILKVGGLVPPGRKVLGDERIDVRSGHFNENWKPENFNIYQVFLSPSMRYAGMDAYAKPSKYKDQSTGSSYTAKVAFQVVICPKSYTVGPQTLGATSQIDPGFDNGELEWSTNEHGSTILYGLLVKLTRAA